MEIQAMIKMASGTLLNNNQAFTVPNNKKITLDKDLNVQNKNWQKIIIGNYKRRHATA